ncbi:MAG: rhodanese-like domain-containing protein [Limnobacter sp.]|nr:rhodanese-like domain-containing protein [Limnobacter sp.]
MNSSGIAQLSAPELAIWLGRPEGGDFVILDVRESWEYDLCHLPDSVHIPLGELTSHTEKLPTDTPIVCLCHHGIRSQRAAMVLSSQGFAPLYNLQGGIDAWSKLVDPSCPTY